MRHIVIHWPRFGPYHLARIKQAATHLGQAGMRVSGLEIASRDEIYSWADETGQPALERHLVFPGRYVEEVSLSDLWRRLSRLLNNIKPALVAINGYGSRDSLVLLAWCRQHSVPAILMSDSKADDFTRYPLREALKRLLVRQYAACLCAGNPHRKYLTNLGMKAERIRIGYDVVDNEFFWHSAEAARRSPAKYRHLPGLESDTPFFLVSSRWIARKNIPGILHAYHRYRQMMRGERTEPWRLIILGDGPEASVVNQIILNKQIEAVSLPGFRQYNDLPSYLGLASVFIHAPLQEQWGLVVNEAMASGLPVLVSTQCGCASDLIIPGVNGFTFDAANVPQLADLMAGFTRGEYDRVSMGAASHAHIQNWGLERFACGLEQLVKICL